MRSGGRNTIRTSSGFRLMGGSPGTKAIAAPPTRSAAAGGSRSRLASSWRPIIATSDSRTSLNAMTVGMRGLDEWQSVGASFYHTTGCVPAAEPMGDTRVASSTWVGCAQVVHRLGHKLCGQLEDGVDAACAAALLAGFLGGSERGCRAMLTREPPADISIASTTWLGCAWVVHRLANNLWGQVFCSRRGWLCACGVGLSLI
jgi:hypothetical protein